MLIALMFSAVAKKSGFPSLPCSANEQVCRSWAKQSRAASPSRPMEIFHVVGVILSL